MKKAFITGISGQDGRNLSVLLLNKGYEVHGLLRRNSIAESQDKRISDLPVKTYYGDITDSTCLERLFREIKPDEIYDLAAMSHVKVSFDTPGYTLFNNSMGAFYVIEAFKNNCPNAKYYRASSSEMFGLSVEDDGYQREQTLMNPVSPYGISKIFGYNLTRHYRRAHQLFACNGILFNHSGKYRSSAFAEAKIVKTACEIKLGLKEELELGNLDSFRDIGNSKDYVRAMWMIMQHHTADDFVVATGKTYSMRDVCYIVFTKLGLNYKDYVIQNAKFLRSEELPYLKGDANKIKRELKWEPVHSFENTLDEMIDHWMKELTKKDCTCP